MRRVGGWRLVVGGSLLALAACQRPQPPITTVPAGHGAVTIEVVPNPIVATPVSGKMYDFPLEVVVRETGGRAVVVQRITATASFNRTLSLGKETWDAGRIQAMGHHTTLAAFGEVRYSFRQRREVPDERLFSGVSAEVKVEAVDDTGTAIEATTVVTVRR